MSQCKNRGWHRGGTPAILEKRNRTRLIYRCPIAEAVVEEVLDEWDSVLVYQGHT